MLAHFDIFRLHELTNMVLLSGRKSNLLESSSGNLIGSALHSTDSFPMVMVHTTVMLAVLIIPQFIHVNLLTPLSIIPFSDSMAP